MSFEAITAINEAEASARQMKADALASAKAAEAAAVEDGRLAVEAARSKAATEVRELRARSDEKATRRPRCARGPTRVWRRRRR